jgi:hypothetical protein
MKDWLGNDLEVGNTVLYSSTSTLTGMNLGEIVTLDESKIQIKLWHVTQHSWSVGRTVTLHRGNGAYRTVTRYFGAIWGEDVEVPR